MLESLFPGIANKLRRNINIQPGDKISMHQGVTTLGRIGTNLLVPHIDSFPQKAAIFTVSNNREVSISLPPDAREYQAILVYVMRSGIVSMLEPSQHGYTTAWPAHQTEPIVWKHQEEAGPQASQWVTNGDLIVAGQFAAGELFIPEHTGMEKLIEMKAQSMDVQIFKGAIAMKYIIEAGRHSLLRLA